MLEDVELSCTRRVVADTLPNTELVYDGAHHALVLPDLDDAAYMEESGAGSGLGHPPCIFVGSGARLRFKNVRVINSRFLLRLTRLAPGGSLSVDAADGVTLDDDEGNEPEGGGEVSREGSGEGSVLWARAMRDPKAAAPALPPPPPPPPTRMHVSVRVMGLTVLLQCHVDGEEERKQAQRDEGRFLQLTLALALEQQMEPDKNVRSHPRNLVSGPRLRVRVSVVAGDEQRMQVGEYGDARGSKPRGWWIATNDSSV